jgi:CRP/FNR family transcriptional regulator
MIDLRDSSGSVVHVGVRRQCRYCSVRARAPCGGLRDTNSLERLDLAHTLPRRVAPGATVVAPGERAASTYTVLNGWVALTDTLKDGQMVIHHFALPGDVIPLELLGDQSTRSAVAVGEATVCAFTPASHQRLRREDGLYDARYQAAIARELHYAYDHFADIALASAAERVAKLLWGLAVRSLHRRPLASDLIPAPLNQIQIGLATGLTAVHVSRTLKQLREQDLIAFEDHTIAIHDPHAVERLTGVSEDLMDMWM